jgi:NADH-quinone oxidoreductase subunit J
MIIDYILFGVLGLVAVVSSVAMITRPSPVISAIFLVLNFFALAGLYLLLNAQFIAVVQVIVYAGAIMVLFLFVLMLLNTESEPQILQQKRNLKIMGIAIAILVFVQIGYIIFYANPSENIVKEVSASVEAGTIETIGTELYTTYVLPFLASGFLLLAATIGAIILAKKKFE